MDAHDKVRTKRASNSTNSSDQSSASTPLVDLSRARSRDPIKYHTSMIDRTTSSGSTYDAIRTRKKAVPLKSCLKATSSPHTHTKKHQKAEEFKKQRVRFYIPPLKTSKLTSVFSVWEPDSAIPGTWSLFLVLPMAYELWAGGFR